MKKKKLNKNKPSLEELIEEQYQRLKGTKVGRCLSKKKREEIWNNIGK